MATGHDDGTASLSTALQQCCADLLATLEDGEVQVAGASAPVDGPGRWRPLVVGRIPGIDQIADIVRPPLEAIAAVLRVLAGILKVLAKLLLLILDPWRALIEMAYNLLKDLINDLLAAGGYLYYDWAPVSSPVITAFETGYFEELEKQFTAGQAGGPPPAPPPDPWDQWAERFAQSFDDPGDEARPYLSDGASVAAVFIAGVAGNETDFRQIAYLLGALLNRPDLMWVWEDFEWFVDDDDLDRVPTHGQPVAPDWQSTRLEELIPPLRYLLRIPEFLKGLLLAGDNIVDLIERLANLMESKANALLRLADAIQAIIDLLDGLAAAGLYVLPVTTTEGVSGLWEAFRTAEDRPEGGYMGAACFLAAGPNLAQASLLWELLGQGGAIDAASAAWEENKQAVGDAADDIEQLVDGDARSADEVSDAFVDALSRAPQSFFDAVGRTQEQVLEAARTDRAVLVSWIEQTMAQSPTLETAPAIDDAVRETATARKRGHRSLAAGFGHRGER